MEFTHAIAALSGGFLFSAGLWAWRRLRQPAPDLPPDYTPEQLAFRDMARAANYCPTCHQEYFDTDGECSACISRVPTPEELREFSWVFDNALAQGHRRDDILGAYFRTWRVGIPRDEMRAVMWARLKD